ncbi:patatin-like phospholipase domain-containing protein 2 [Mizuhopecten yessoensis]|uniref:triacylglycerol lipase n=1 Tax=Mizuhopecten yessoensis TaxID=6573 RepID=A0A210R6D0_MIZYE|nr:patatin-like phospholipase domain-containing protein 2 [Mizuhopecten yessoensis]OWF56590.1 Patatin-like phospholipase domain-containing protein 2 [Mizuhopecten yessoensis]
MNFSFAGCGFLGIYHVGVASCLKQHVPQLVDNVKFGGASAGAIVACCLMCDCCLGKCTSFTLRLASKARYHSLGPLHPSFDINRILRDALNEVLPENAHKITSGRLHISLTRVSDRKAVIISEYESKDELIQALLTSAFVPLYSGLVPPSFRGVRYVDGGLSDNIPQLNSETITVSPFCGESDICPRDSSANLMHITLSNTSFQCSGDNLYRMSRALFPPHPEILSDMCQEGFDDCLRFLQRNNLISCTRHLSVRSSIVSVSKVLSKAASTDPIDDEDELSSGDETFDEEMSDLCEGNHEQDEECADCKKKVQVALIDTLPPSVVEAFQATYDSMNKGIIGCVRQNRACRLILAISTPWLLPADIFYTYTLRVLQYLPSLPSDVQTMCQEGKELLQALLSHLSRHSSKYTARFTCQLAITEVNYPSGGDIEKALASNDPFQPHPEEPIVRNLNIGFAVDFETDRPNSIQSLRHLEGRMEHMDLNGIELQSQGQGQNLHISTDLEQLQASQVPCQLIFDTFEQCLHISNEQESVMAYYYKDENNSNTYNFQEIYNIDNVDMNIPNTIDLMQSSNSSSTVKMSDDSKASWDNFMEKNPNLEHEVDEHIQHEVSLVPATAVSIPGLLGMTLDS